MSSRLLASVLVVLFLLLHLQSNGVVECATCVSHGRCGCKLDNGRGVIDLSPMIAAAGQSPMFKNVKSNNPLYTFNVDMCSDFSCAAQKQSRVCLQVQSYLSMSVGKTLTFDYYETSGVVTFVYSDTAFGQEVSTRISMHCSPSTPGIGLLAPFEADSQGSHYTTTLSSRFACFNRTTNIKCVSHGTCGCKLDNGGGIIDLSPMIAAAGQSPMFKNVQSNDLSYTFNVDMCSDFSCGTQQQSKVCLQVQSYLSMSVGKTLTFDYDETSGVVAFVYSDTVSGQEVSTKILMHCSSSTPGIGLLSPFEADSQNSHYTSTLSSRFACFDITNDSQDVGDVGAV